MSPGIRKFALSVHLAVSVGWVGAVVAYLAVGVAAQTSDDVQTVRSGWIAMELIGWYAIVPLAIGSLVSGLVMALGTKWGLFRHYWVLFSLALTIFATIVLLFHMPSVSTTADFARDGRARDVVSLGGDLGHPSIGLGVLLVILVLNMYKPRGMTGYGRRGVPGASDA